MIRVREWIDWGAGERHAESVYIADMTAICDREVLPLPDRNFSVSCGHESSGPTRRSDVPLCEKPRVDASRVTENEIKFRCYACGHQWSSKA